MSVFITLKNIDDQEKLGGVGVYYKVLRRYLSDGIAYVHFSEDNSLNPIKKFFFRMRDAVTFTRLCKKINKSNHIIHFNPSLNWSGVLRDGLLLLIASMHGIKTIVFFRGWHSYLVRIIDRNRFVRTLFKWIYNRAHVFIVLSTDFKEKLHAWGFRQNMYVETTAVDNALLKGYSLNTLSKENNQNVNILFLARVEKEKGIYEVIDTYQILRQKYAEIKLTIAGDGSRLDDIRKIVETRNLPDVSFTGYVTNEVKAKTFAESDLYFFPSYHGEGMPNSVLEAMAFGLPVITRPAGGLEDFFENGQMGFMTESKDPGKFAGYIGNLIANPDLRQWIGEYNAAFARRHFLASVVAKRLERIYADVLKGDVEERSWMDDLKQSARLR